MPLSKGYNGNCTNHWQKWCTSGAATICAIIYGQVVLLLMPINRGIIWEQNKRVKVCLASIGQLSVHHRSDSPTIYAKANLKSAFTSMQSSQKINRHEQSNKNSQIWHLASCHQQTVLQGSNRSLPFLCELYFSPYSIMVAIFVLIPLNNVPQGRRKLEFIFGFNHGCQKKKIWIVIPYLSVSNIHIIGFDDIQNPLYKITAQKIPFFLCSVLS